MDFRIRVDLGGDFISGGVSHIREVSIGDLDWKRSTRRFPFGWIHLENFILVDLAGDLDPHLDLNVMS